MPKKKSKAKPVEQLEIITVESDGLIKIDFGTNLRWVVLQPEQARMLGSRLLRFAHEDEMRYEG